MKKIKVHSAVTIVVFAGLVAIVSFEARTGRGQSQAQKNDTQNPKSESLVKPTVLATDRAATKGAAMSPFAEAAAQNFTLRNELTWTFGSKQQHGWYLYDLLIGQTLNVQPAAATPDFAIAVSTWQKQKGFSPNGVLDENSWMALVSQWQADRLKDKTPATPDQLLTAPPSEFYDPERLPELRQVERSTYAAYKAMLAAAIADPALKLAHTPQGELAPTEKYFKIVSSFRTRISGTVAAAITRCGKRRPRNEQSAFHWTRVGFVCRGRSGGHERCKSRHSSEDARVSMAGAQRRPLRLPPILLRALALGICKVSASRFYFESGGLPYRH